jgi:cytosine/adenosine deaminase-related metal-dependent hydrolase
MDPVVLTARSLLCEPGRWIEGGGLVLHGGRVRAVLDSPGAVARAGLTLRDLGDVLLTPGLVNAHAHLELGTLAGALPPDEGFVAWVEALIASKAHDGAEDFARAVAVGAERLLAGGTTCVGDVDSTGAAGEGLDSLLRGGRRRRVCGEGGLRARIYHEVLDAGDERRTAGALERLSKRLVGGVLDSPGAAPCRGEPGRYEGIAPHAPYTVSPTLLAACGKLQRESGQACSIHWAETEEEARWMERGEGEFARLLNHSPGVRGLDAIEAAGLLGAGTSLVHANHTAPGERERIARAGAVVVHCPGTNEFFGRSPFDFRAWMEAGVDLALGTDSLASNDDLDMRKEMALARASADLEPADVWSMATLGGARAVGLAGSVGALVEGAWADLVAWPWSGGGPAAALDALTAGELRPGVVLISGHPLREGDG